MSLHKLSAATGYMYLLRSTARNDLDGPGAPDLGAYYSEKGETPGLWTGAGLVGLREQGGTVQAGHRVTQSHMQALLGEGIHPQAEQITEHLIAEGVPAREAMQAAKLGRAFLNLDADTTFRQRLAIGYNSFRRENRLQRPLTEHERSAVRDEVARRVYVEENGHEPLDAGELSAFLARKMRPDAIGVAGYDLTFSPVKSVSVLWAVAPQPVAQAVRQAHRDAVADVVSWLEEEVVYTRRGASGVRKTETRGLIATEFEHRDSRAGDPDLHTHLAISNKVQDAADGAWLAIDGSVLYRATVAASERYNTRLEALLTERLGVAFAPVSRDDGLREVREVEGIDVQLIQAWSSRRAAIEGRRNELVSEFRQRHGRVPTPEESVKLAQQATLETRGSKREPGSEADQRLQWHREAAEVLGDSSLVETMVWTALAPAARQDRRSLGPKEAAQMVVERVSSQRARWQPTHVRAEAERLARTTNMPRGQVDEWVNLVVSRATSPAVSVRIDAPTRMHNDPVELRRSNGDSVYEAPLGRLYATPGTIAAEDELLEIARESGARTVSEATVAVALLEQEANGQPLNGGQTQMVRELATSGRRVQLVLAPAGTGKTTAMRVLANAWRDSGAQVVALAPTASAGVLIGEEIGAPGDTLAKLAHALHGQSALPSWAANLSGGTLVVIDEAGLAGTKDLRDAVSWLVDRGAVVRLLGDDRQLASVGAGGILRDIAREVGTVSLAEVVRFNDAEEAAVSLAVREGDAAAVAWWADHGRLHVGSVDAQIAEVVTAWQADHRQGRDTIMLASTREHVRALNDEARSRRVATAEVDAAHCARGRAGAAIGVGDAVIARRNDRRIHISSTHWIKNGDRFFVTRTHPDGSLSVKHDGTGRTITLDRDYVLAHVDLGYASTIHSAQGMTVDVSHTLLTGEEDRQALYVSTSRGRMANHCHVPMSTDGSEHSIVRPEAVCPETAVEVLEGIIRRDGAALSARSTRAEADDPWAHLSEHIVIYEDARNVAILSLVDATVLARIDQEANDVHPGLTEHSGWDTLRTLLAEISLQGSDPIDALWSVHDAREVQSARDVAAVLWWRLAGESAKRAGASSDADLAWVSPLPAAVAAHQVWGPYLRARVGQIEDETRLVRAGIGYELRSGQPRWAAGFAHQPALVHRVAMWRATHDVPQDEMRPLGGAAVTARQALPYERLEKWIDSAITQGRQDDQAWTRIADELDPRVTQDPWWRVVRSVLGRAHTQGRDCAQILRAAMEQTLPAEKPATALWWRLQEKLGVDVAADGPTRLYPSWMPTLHSQLDGERVEAAMASTDWSAFVDVVSERAQSSGSEPEEVVAHLIDVVADRPPDDLISAAVLHGQRWRAQENPTPNQSAAQQSQDAPSPEDLAWYAQQVLASCPTVVGSSHSWGHEPDPAADEAAPTAEDESFLDVLRAGAAPSSSGSGDQAREAARARIIQANEAAWDLWRNDYHGSSAEAALVARFGAMASTIEAGQAAPSWAGLTTSLRSQGFTDEELIAADLARHSRRGTLIDTYRDRLMLAIRVQGRIVGFTGRRLDDSDAQAPKYLNGASTDAWVKGATLFGMDDLAACPQAHAVLVEGVVDALAVTAAGGGNFVGVAPLGTAFTPAQADLLRGQQVVVVFDADAAGDKAARTAYTMLTDRGIDPLSLDLPRGADPADILAAHGAERLAQTLHQTRPLIERILDQALQPFERELAAHSETVWVEERVRAARMMAPLVVAAPPHTWADLAAHVGVQLDLMPETLATILEDAAANRVPDAAQESIQEPDAAAIQAAYDRLMHRTQHLGDDLETTIDGLSQDSDAVGIEDYSVRGASAAWDDGPGRQL